MDISLLNFRLQKYIFFQKQQKIKTNFLFTLFITLYIPIIKKNTERNKFKKTVMERNSACIQMLSVKIRKPPAITNEHVAMIAK